MMVELWSVGGTFVGNIDEQKKKKDLTWLLLGSLFLSVWT